MFNLSKILILFSAFTISVNFAKAQNINPGPDLIFNPKYVAVIKVTMSESEKQWLLDKDNRANNEYLKCELHFKNANIDEVRTNVGIRIRGNTSREHAKKSFKFKFTEWEGEKFYGHKKFNLKANNNDPTLIREHMSLSVYRNANVPAARSHFCRLFINNEFMGVYSNIEQIDDEFLDRRYYTEEGNLYKCMWGASLELGNDIYDENVFELETNKDLNDRSGLQNFIDVLNKTSDNNFKSEIEKVLNVENALRFLAVEAIIGHWDGYAYNKNNFYIHENPITNKIEFIAYDLDNTFGINWIPNDWAVRDLKKWANENDARPLHNRLLNVPEYYDWYIDICTEIIEKYFNETALFWQIEDARDRIKRFVEEDSYYEKTYGFLFTDFLNSYNDEVIRHCPYGIKPYVSARVKSAKDQIPTINSIEHKRKSLKIVYNGNGIFTIKSPSVLDNQIIKAFSIEGRQIPVIKLSANSFYLVDNSKVVIIKYGTITKKVVLHN